jgi:hypothetical protein
MIPASDVLWPLASRPERGRWAAQAVERDLHMARIILFRAEPYQGPEAVSRHPAVLLYPRRPRSSRWVTMRDTASLAPAAGIPTRPPV